MRFYIIQYEMIFLHLDSFPCCIATWFSCIWVVTILAYNEVCILSFRRIFLHLEALHLMSWIIALPKKMHHCIMHFSIIFLYLGVLRLMGPMFLFLANIQKTNFLFSFSIAVASSAYPIHCVFLYAQKLVPLPLLCALHSRTRYLLLNIPRSSCDKFL